MGNCVSCGNKGEGEGKKFKGMDGNKTADNKRISKMSDVTIDKKTWILTNDGKFSEKYSMG